MSCQELLMPYVRWAAQEQIVDPSRYVLGISITSTSTNGEAIFIRGYGDITEARFSPDGQRFRVRIRGVGRRLTASIQSHLAASDTNRQQPGYVADEQPVIDSNSRVLVHVDANQEQVRVRVGDVALREVVDSFMVDCQDGFFIGFSAGRAYLVSLQYVERTADGWRLHEEPASAAGETAPPPVIEADATEETAPVKTDAPDDLERIEGIGPKAAAALNELGITHFAQLAAYEPEKLAAELQAAGVNVGPDTSVMTWPAQAALAAAGRWNALRYLQDTVLKGGRVGLPDDLRRINGIGPAMVRHLDALGITTFAEIASANPEQLEIALRNAGARLAAGAAATWPEEAALARDHRWIELEAYQQAQGDLEHALEDSETPEL